MAVFIPLNGPGHDKPKAPSALGWTDLDYRGVASNYGGWVGMRTDGLVVVDCDSADAARRWADIVGCPIDRWPTYTILTPRGYHFYYEWVEGAPAGPYTDILGDNSGIDIRAGRTSQVVVPPTPGYEYVAIPFFEVEPYDPSWWTPPDRHRMRTMHAGEGWVTVPDGKRNDTLARIGGTMRACGAAVPIIERFLLGLNRAFCDPPMHEEEVVHIARSLGRYDPDPVLEFEDE